jgi:hypothetical protein
MNTLHTIMNKSRRFIDGLNKSIKNKSKLRKCERFCKKDYMVSMDDLFKASAKKYNVSYTEPTKVDRMFSYHECKKTYCNKKCKGFNQTKSFYKELNHGFQKSDPQRMIQLRKRGALSECIYGLDYNP